MTHKTTITKPRARHIFKKNLTLPAAKDRTPMPIPTTSTGETTGAVLAMPSPICTKQHHQRETHRNHNPQHHPLNPQVKKKSATWPSTLYPQHFTTPLLKSAQE
jgi:hypothetical protein